SIPRWINSADGILDMTVGSLLPVAPSTRLVHAPTSVGRSTTPAKWLPAETGAGRFMLTYQRLRVLTPQGQGLRLSD
ncbi:MAG: hypothetical protein LC775_14590, partial [Acidobacteria bacterium]|nr:hypothetical protein [Acidobacteriota bacterium]